eukprot:m51a1_g7787 hypothetical protein (72) ;mRNA; r:641-1003
MCLAISVMSTDASPEHSEMPFCIVIVVGLFITQIEASDSNRVGGAGCCTEQVMSGKLGGSPIKCHGPRISR